MGDAPRRLASGLIVAARGARDSDARCLGLLQQVNETNGILMITMNGKPYAEVRPCVGNLNCALAGFRGSVVASGDLVGPIGEVWEAAQ